jgi:tetratricopeptide (TPR) repeat protein
MKFWLAIPILLLAQGCASTRTDAPAREALFRDTLFAAPTERIDASEIFAASQAMRDYVRHEIAALIESKGRQQGLVDALYSSNKLKLQYDAEKTRNASEAFDARSGNCLSLVVMTATLAKELGLQVRYQRVFTDDAWSRVGDLQFASGHVNLTLGRRNNDPRPLSTAAERNALTIDFIPPPPDKAVRAYSIPEETVVAMFMNNRAAEALAAGRIDDAYWWTRAAIRHDPEFLAAFNTLGVIYNRHGNAADSRRVLAYVLEREPSNVVSLSNLAIVMRGEGRAEEAQALTQRLAKLQPNPPFHFYDQGRAAMRTGDYAAARDFFVREVERDPNYHEFQFWLGTAYLLLGDPAAARRHLMIAVENSTTRGEREIYAAKLDRVRAGKGL